MKFRGQNEIFLVDEDLVESKFAFDGEPAGFSSHYTAWSGLKGAFALTIFLKINPFMKNPILSAIFLNFEPCSVVSGVC